ncbi:hypothetical protein UAJ10_02095 [Nitrospirillum sp. BR 11164]|uniref:hypothetical protein n=1 Tax=Nitrospirillum sp. BR 11164 TaxID=3104324 RepID=UPI002AFE5AD0|nr:hypothetical protein [Nitrospirillum sp. BR 11164]MEA1647810.1 hypothetical protein [Nitrospirillum sp. BR 11164]
MTGRLSGGAGGALSRALLGLLLLAFILLLMLRPALSVALDSQGHPCTLVRVVPDVDEMSPTQVAKPGPPSFGPDAYGD